ncbi:MAG TPA: wax ester/triacylglycerol synthase family O-acyltransferase [Terriglobales bacterium]|nr:wax ester/triacylglycerol synthase family O-acyltransferase [Terriglobales bacterium]
MPKQEVQSLSWGDAIFLYLEREGAPLHIASVNIFEGHIPLASCRRFIESKLPLIPRYRQRVITAPFNIGLPNWEYDPDFDIHNHVREIKLRHGTEAELQAAAGKLLTARMDRRHPLWDFTLFRLQGNRTGILARVHHCLADGIAGVGVMNVLMDPTPVRHRLPRKLRAFQAPPPKDDLTLLLDGWVSTYADLVQRLLSAQEQTVTLAQKVLAAGGRWPANEFLRLLPEIGAPTERLRFNVICRGPQKFVWAEVSLDHIKAIKNIWGGTVNDVVLTLVTATIRRYLLAHSDSVSGRLFRMMVPVNVRNGANSHDLGNRISLLPVTIPLGIRSPRRLLAAVHKRMEFLKTAHIAEIVGVAGGLIGIVPTALQALAGPVAGQLPLTPFNLVCTNVPGPQFPLYLLGHKMLNWYPYVPIGGDMALNCAVLSYNGVTYFGFTGDSQAAPDLKRLEKFLQSSLAEMLKAAGYKRPRKAATAEGRNKSSNEDAKPEGKIKPKTKTRSVEDKTQTEEAKPVARGENKAAEAQPAAVIPLSDVSLLHTLARSA